MLVVVRTEGSSIERDDAIDFLRGRVVDWWLPNDVVFVEKLPHSTTGKLQKARLCQDFQDYRLPDDAGA